MIMKGNSVKSDFFAEFCKLYDSFLKNEQWFHLLLTEIGLSPEFSSAHWKKLHPSPLGLEQPKNCFPLFGPSFWTVKLKKSRLICQYCKIESKFIQ